MIQNMKHTRTHGCTCSHKYTPPPRKRQNFFLHSDKREKKIKPLRQEKVLIDQRGHWNQPSKRNTWEPLRTQIFYPNRCRTEHTPPWRQTQRLTSERRRGSSTEETLIEKGRKLGTRGRGEARLWRRLAIRRWCGLRCWLGCCGKRRRRRSASPDRAIPSCKERILFSLRERERDVDNALKGEVGWGIEIVSSPSLKQEDLQRDTERRR